MSALLARGGLLATALARVEDFLLEPAEPRLEESPASSLRRPVVAVFGLARHCGATTVARALAAELAARDAGAAAVSSPMPAAGIPLASPWHWNQLFRTFSLRPCGSRRTAWRIRTMPAPGHIRTWS